MLSAFNEASLAELSEPNEGLFEALDVMISCGPRDGPQKNMEGFSKFSKCIVLLRYHGVSNTRVSSPRLTSQMQGARRMSIGWVSPTKTHGKQGNRVGMTRPNEPWSPEGMIG